ncbi:MAG: 30S ribosomal protein S5 [Gammaproteobacteria bacterium CG11_big_fil_rev_8_21_14_0_20_46_22]|nr:MAG: 30S ribosomal protein S5 [Gammaproteobacteria bacterium CG12_big_fil_rev_8_21_14_0_65_46_12]PIR11324.1 MAG: 30S ribosomal protein S5 [Gammaproteobacteria bacterium CG11_big_fil_rev_8_21_14_0_20_46_22]
MSNPQAENVLDSRVVDIRRTTKVVKGGRDFSFSATAVVGDGSGTVGYGRGKAKEVTIAIQKATDSARRNMKKIGLTQDGTIHHRIVVSHGATEVMMKPAAGGTGIIAGGAMRDVFEVLGMHNVSAKITGSANPTNVVIATIKGLAEMKTPESIAAKRGKSVKQIVE